MFFFMVCVKSRRPDLGDGFQEPLYMHRRTGANRGARDGVCVWVGSDPS